MSVRTASSNNTAEPKCDMLVSSMTYIAHNSLVFYSCTYHLRLKPGSDATVGERSNFKIFLRTHRIMVIHSNKRGECCPHTLVDRKRKRYDNAVDVVIRLHDRPILVPNVRHLRVLHAFSSMTSHEFRSSRVLRESFVSTSAW